MICIICRRASLVAGYSTVTLQRLDQKIVNVDTPTRKCPSCGELYVEEQVTLRLLREAERIFEEGLHETVWQYED